MRRFAVHLIAAAILPFWTVVSVSAVATATFVAMMGGWQGPREDPNKPQAWTRRGSGAGPTSAIRVDMLTRCPICHGAVWESDLDAHTQWHSDEGTRK